MMRYLLPPLALLGSLPGYLAAPAPIAEPLANAASATFSKDAAHFEDRRLVGKLLSGVMDTVNSAIAANDPLGLTNALNKITPASRPADLMAVMSQQSAIWGQSTRTDFFQAVATQLASGLILDGTLNQAITGGLPVGENSVNNNNPAPPTNIYPKKDPRDAPYTLSDAELRKVIYIPPGFTYGQKPPVIFIPGTGSYGGSTFRNNLRKLLTGSSFADPVWVNLPAAALMDVQINVEYVAYAINYISSVSRNSQDISIISWSQGGLDTQWVLKYWPSTRDVIKDFLPVSADFKGTVLANVLCLSADSSVGLSPLCPPSVVQQEATSQLIATLRRNNGDSAYVPTTSFYSGFFDEIVQPQSGSEASANLRDVRGVGVANIEVQRVCAGKIGGSFYDHAGLLFNPLVYAMIVDALTHEGPGDLSRLDLDAVCDSYAADGLDLDDVLATSGLIPIAGALLLTYPEKTFTEPPLRPYAR